MDIGALHSHQHDIKATAIIATTTTVKPLIQTPSVYYKWYRPPTCIEYHLPLLNFSVYSMCDIDCTLQNTFTFNFDKKYMPWPISAPPKLLI